MKAMLDAIIFAALAYAVAVLLVAWWSKRRHQ